MDPTSEQVNLLKTCCVVVAGYGHMTVCSWLITTSETLGAPSLGYGRGFCQADWPTVVCLLVFLVWVNGRGVAKLHDARTGRRRFMANRW